MPATPGRLLKMPSFACVSKTAFNRFTDLGAPSAPIDAQDFSIATWVRENCFESSNNSRLAKPNRGLPIVGNLSASAELLGLRSGNYEEFVGLARGQRKLSSPSNDYTIWEPSNYFGRPGSLLKIPKVVLIAASQTTLPVRDEGDLLIDLRDAFDARYDEIEHLGLQIILDESANSVYNPYAYGVPLTSHNQPFSTPAFIGFTAGDLLVIYFSNMDTELGCMGFGSNGRFSGLLTPTSGLSQVFHPYYFYRGEIYTDGILDEPLYYNQFTAPSDDVAAWNAVAHRYNRRRHIIHKAQFNVSPIPWIVKSEFFSDPGPPDAFTYGTSPHGYGSTYIEQTKAADMTVGRDFYYNPDGVSPTVEDIVEAILEDIQDFYG